MARKPQRRTAVVPRKRPRKAPFDEIMTYALLQADPISTNTVNGRPYPQWDNVVKMLWDIRERYGYRATIEVAGHFLLGCEMPVIGENEDAEFWIEVLKYRTKFDADTDPELKDRP